MSRVVTFDRLECRPKRSTQALARTLAAMKSLASSSCSVLCGRPSQQARTREMACVRNKLFSLARIAFNESQRATTVTSGVSDLPEHKARAPRYPSCSRASSITEERIVWNSGSLPGLLPRGTPAFRPNSRERRLLRSFGNLPSRSRISCPLLFSGTRQFRCLAYRT